MKFEDVRNLYRQLDCTSNWDDDDHMYMQAYAKTQNELLVVRFGGGKQSYLYRLHVDSVPDAYSRLEGGIPICDYANGVLYAGEYYYSDFPENPEPYDPDSGAIGILDVDMDQDWKLSEVKYLRRVAEEQLSQAAYEFKCSKEALELIDNN